MSHLYEAAPDMGGWNEKAKKDEMREEGARYIFDRDCSAFVYFQFSIDDDEPVVYCYELQVAEKARGKGSGSQLLAVMEQLGVKYGMRLSKLTCFKRNIQAMDFYTKHGYVVDSTSPSLHLSRRQLERVSYEILSKCINNGLS